MTVSHYYFNNHYLISDISIKDQPSSQIMIISHHQIYLNIVRLTFFRDKGQSLIPTPPVRITWVIDFFIFHIEYFIFYTIRD
jgi:hypothetical protein